ncbi:hypothetical protein EJB05_02848, partial [Eragrostis curvula]
MKSSVGIAFLVPILLVLAIDTADATINGGDLLLPACKTVAGGSTFFDVEFCVSALGSDDNRIRDAVSYGDFAAVAVDLLTENATATAARITGLMNRAGEDEAMTRCLESCHALYEGVLDRQRGCVAAVMDGEFGEAAASLEKSAAAAEECEGGFGKSGVASPVKVEDDCAFKLAKLAVALLRFAS